MGRRDGQVGGPGGCPAAPPLPCAGAERDRARGAAGWPRGPGPGLGLGPGPGLGPGLGLGPSSGHGPAVVSLAPAPRGWEGGWRAQPGPKAARVPGE